LIATNDHIYLIYEYPNILMTKTIMAIALAAIMVIGTLGFNSEVFAANPNANEASPANGGNSNGLPFQNLQANIDEVESSLQDQIDDLQLQIDDLVADVEDLAGDLAAEILARAEAISDLEDALAEHEADDILALEDLASQIDDNRNELAELLEATGNNADDIADLLALIEANQDNIDDLESDVADLQDELLLKQNAISGVCPSGEAAVEILDDGTLVCEEVASAAVSIVSVARTSNTFSHTHSFNHCHLEILGICFDNHTHFFSTTHYSSSNTASCPAGSEVTGGGHASTTGTVTRNHHNGESTWHVSQSGADPHDWWQTTARCLSVP
jgi:peptidoglycan hydrolase CwlO-like protein